jgi:hypothetical protein
VQKTVADVARVAVLGVVAYADDAVVVEDEVRAGFADATSALIAAERRRWRSWSFLSSTEVPPHSRTYLRYMCVGVVVGLGGSCC